MCVAVYLKQCVCSGNSSSSAAPVVNEISLFVGGLKGSAEEVICYIYIYWCDQLILCFASVRSSGFLSA